MACLSGLPRGFLSGLSILAWVLVLRSTVVHATDVELCDRPGRWIDPDNREFIQIADIYPDLSRQQVVLLGERHDNAEHHRWQLHTLAALHAYQPDLLLGLEMFPRSTQAILDRWVAGKLSEADFLRAVDWPRIWGFDSALYLPLMHFARLHGIPLVALNVERSLVSAVGQGGWAAVPVEQREGVGDPAPASSAYREQLAEVFLAKQAMHGHADASVQPDELDDPAALVDDSGFQYFVEAQLTWDRAMAEALVQARETHQVALAVGIMGQGHVLFGHGVSYQLGDLGVQQVADLVPLTVSEDCQGLLPTMARAVFTVPAYQPTVVSKPRLGVMIEDAETGVRITRVVEDSVAAAAGLRADDVIFQAAGETLVTSADLIRVVQRQAPGTWLPLAVQRTGESLELVARFPPMVGDP